MKNAASEHMIKNIYPLLRRIFSAAAPAIIPPAIPPRPIAPCVIPIEVSDIPQICTTITGIPTSIIADKIRLNSAIIPNTERKIGFSYLTNLKLSDRSEPTAPKMLLLSVFFSKGICMKISITAEKQSSRRL